MLIGNVGKDPELKYTPTGIPVTSFRLATSEVWKDRDGNLQEHTDWHIIVAWRGLAEVINKLVHRGSRVYIEGRIQTRTFDDKNVGKKHVVEILADNMLLLDSRKSGRDDYDILESRESTSNDDFGYNVNSKFNNDLNDDISRKQDEFPF